MIKTYSDLRRLETFQDRYEYLKLSGIVGKSTFGFDRYLNQMLYRSRRWRDLRQKLIIRDNGCDLGVDGYEIYGKIIIHHMNPITIEAIELGSDEIFDPNQLICTSFKTHNAIHYGDSSLLPILPVERHPNDTCPWK